MHHLICNLAGIDHSVIKAIFHFLNSEAKNIVAVVPFEKKFGSFDLKIKANFIKDHYKEVRNIFIVNWENKECAAFFITKNFSKYESQLYAILEKIRYYFKKLPGNHKRIVNFPVNDPDYFEELAYLIIPRGKENDPRFLSTCKAIILFFFECGEFGRRTPDEPAT
ncbi:MAG: hypothetical protein ACYDA4_06245 [Ignavibacteriaceae bacterium]